MAPELTRRSGGGGSAALTWAMMAFGLLLALSVAVVRHSTYSGAAISLVSLLAVAAIWWGSRLHRPEHPMFWRLCSAALVAGIVGGALTAGLSGSPSGRALVAAVYLAGYAMYIAAGITLLPRRNGERDWAAILDTVTLVAVGALLYWYLAISRMLDEVTSLDNVLTAFVWPVFDLTLLLVLVRLLLSGVPRSVPLGMVSVGLMLSFATDFWWAMATAEHGEYTWGSVSDFIWVLPMAANGAAALHPDMRSFGAWRTGDDLQATPITHRRVLVVGVAAIVAVLLPLLHAVATGRLEAQAPALIIGGSVVMVASALRSAEMVRQVNLGAHHIHELNQVLDATLRERDGLNAELARRALHDDLTGLPNRRHLQELLAGGDPRSEGRTMLFLDIDDFKVVNDTLGHAVGDALLVAFAHRIKSCLRPTDIFARVGGDEFVVVLEDTTPEGAEQVGERLLAALDEPLEVANRSLSLHSSIGLARSDQDMGPDDLLRRADLGMYRAKSAGKGRLARYEPRYDDLTAAAVEPTDH